MYVEDWQINGEIREVTSFRKIIVFSDRPCERRVWMVLRDLPTEECAKILHDMMHETRYDLE